MSTLFIAILVIAAVAVLVWNFVPAIRERMRGYTTTLESAVIAVMPFVGNAIDAFQDTDWKTYIPPSAWPWIVAGLAGWFIFKRITTSTPVGKA